MQKQSGFGVIEMLVAVVVVAVLAGAGYLFVQNMNSDSNVEDTKSSTESATVDHEDHDAMMADWKTFTSETYNFSFKYPKEWSVVEEEVESFPNQPNAKVKNESGKEVFGIYGYLGAGCETPITGNEPTETITVADTEVTVAKNCNSSWSWITAEAVNGDKLIVTTWDFLGMAEEEDARMALDSLTGVAKVLSNSNN